MTSIGDGAFWNCSNLTSITIPNGVTSIGDHTFYQCWNLTSITIPNSVTSIGDGAFSGCFNLTSITIPNSVTSIGEYVFSQCFKLSFITIPNSVTSIGENAFCYCSSLTSVTIPNSVTSIGEDAFQGCSSLTSVASKMKTPIKIGKWTFTNRANATLYVLKGSKAAYEAADYWKEFKEIVEIDFIIGDANGDGNVYDSDINAIADYIIKGKTERFVFTNADANEDQKVNAADIVELINRIKK